MQAKIINYSCEQIQYQGFCAYDDINAAKKPLILICHDWSGKNSFVEDKAKMFAELGYVGFAVDMYGEGKVGKTYDEKKSLMQSVLEKREVIVARLNAAIRTLSQHPMVDSTRIAIVGFCFGGLCALDLLRSGTPIKAAISFHGTLNPPPQTYDKPIHGKALILHGYNDPMVEPKSVMAFADEMSHAKVDWQIHMYGNVYHAFTNPEAQDINLGLVYDETAAHRSFATMLAFLKEVI